MICSGTAVLRPRMVSGGTPVSSFDVTVICSGTAVLRPGVASGETLVSSFDVICDLL